MILNNAPQNEAIMSNVGEIGEFRIRNSAKAFNILSSGLYANKIKAIIRELSCNAVDSHVAAGKADVPFEVTLPNTLEPHFIIRDFGTGLSHEQVTQIYTTYFESTKTTSNEFIGALGLGSKSPFSYTDNFTVTAIKDGVKGIYSAFINGEGVPSIALMMTEQTDEPAGVEVKFSVNDRYDFNKFREEAQNVYRYFKLQPTVKGSSNFKIEPRRYDTKNLVPGVHVYEGDRSRQSVAIMGNIAYPIAVPNESQLGGLAKLLQCGLEIEFAIGEVDFQASREGLSYIPETVDAIRKKLEAVNGQLAKHIAAEADKLENTWDRAIWLAEKAKTALWHEAAVKYATDTKLVTFDPKAYHKLKEFRIDEASLKALNISLRGFTTSRGSRTCSSLKSQVDWSNRQLTYWSIGVDPSTAFVINDTKIGASERAKYHYRMNADQKVYSRAVYVLEPEVRGTPMDTDAFFAMLSKPPVSRIKKASELIEKPRADGGLGRNVSILHLEHRKRGWSESVVWADAGKIDSFDVTKTHYYVPLSGYVMQSDYGMTDVKEVVNHMERSGLSALKGVKVYGVRKADLEDIKARANWVNLEKHIASVLTKPDNNLIMNMVQSEVGRSLFTTHQAALAGHGVDPRSPFVKFNDKFKGVTRTEHDEYSLRSIYQTYGKAINFNHDTVVKAMRDELTAVMARYPMLGVVNGSFSSSQLMADYIKLVDSSKGV
jgi:hypothetical protein